MGSERSALFFKEVSDPESCVPELGDRDTLLSFGLRCLSLSHLLRGGLGTLCTFVFDELRPVLVFGILGCQILLLYLKFIPVTTALSKISEIVCICTLFS